MMTEFDHGFDPVSTMTVLLAIRWAIPAWELDVSQEKIQNCFQKALAGQETEEMGDKKIILEVEQGIQSLELSNSIQDAMNINQFLNPLDEQVTDSLVDLDDMILSQFGPPTIEGSDDDNPGQPIPRVSSGEALDCLSKLCLYEEQQIDGDQPLICHLVRHERVLLKKQAEKQQQIQN